MIELLNRASAANCGLFLFHSHGGGKARMSSDDLASARELLPKFQLVVPSRPHGSVVMTESSAAGLILMPGQDVLADAPTVRTFRHHMVTWPVPDDPLREHLRFDRQPLARGSQVRKILAGCAIAVVGQSGGGTQVTQQLLQLGVGEVMGIDDDRVEEGNRVAGVGIGENDILKRRLKVETVRRNIARLFPSARYVPVRARLPERKALEAVKRADLIVGCVNNLHARADIQDVALRYLIPYADIGLTIAAQTHRAEEFALIQAISGSIFTFIPGGPCMWCTEFLTDQKLAEETRLRGRPYLETGDNTEALVVSFNGLLASQAVTEVLRLITGFGPQDEFSVYRKYDGFAGALVPCCVKKNESCTRCNRLLGLGDPVWKPPSQLRRTG
jgi:hypothetical protein